MKSCTCARAIWKCWDVTVYDHLPTVGGIVCGKLNYRRHSTVIPWEQVHVYLLNTFSFMCACFIHFIVALLYCCRAVTVLKKKSRKANWKHWPLGNWPLKCWHREIKPYSSDVGPWKHVGPHIVLTDCPGGVWLSVNEILLVLFLVC